jgi:eukaryotic-like serine/threonine-protein kinase
VGEAESFGRYKVTGTLGTGAMGHVYAAVDDVLGREVAVKTLHNRGGGLGGKIVDERFRLEARAVAGLTHPGIVQVYDIDLTADPPYIVMERVTGPSLKERFETGPMTANELRALGIQIARALAAAHAANIVHRDVKPANILIAGPGTWKLADFGVAHVPDSSLTMTGQFVGSPAYASPEALIRGQSTAAGDVFGLGATLYLGAAGRWPRMDAINTGLLAPVPSLRELAPELPADLIAAIDRAVALEADQRPTAAELADVLAGGTMPRTLSPIATSSAPLAIATSSTDSTTGPRAVRWKPWAIAAGAIALLIGIAAVTGGSKSSTPALVPAAAAAPDDPPPGQVRAVSPAMPDPHAANDWNKLVDKLYERKFGEARRKLDEWEHHWGATEETRSLRRQLDAMPPEDERRDDERREDERREDERHDHKH